MLSRKLSLNHDVRNCHIVMYIIVYWNVHQLESSSSKVSNTWGFSVAYFDMEEQRPETVARLWSRRNFWNVIWIFSPNGGNSEFRLIRGPGNWGRWNLMTLVKLDNFDGIWWDCGEIWLLWWNLITLVGPRDLVNLQFLTFACSWNKISERIRPKAAKSGNLSMNGDWNSLPVLVWCRMKPRLTSILCWIRW